MVRSTTLTYYVTTLISVIVSLGFNCNGQNPENQNKQVQQKFQSLNFKLVVINELLKKGHFEEEFEELKSKYWKWNDYSYQPIIEILTFCKTLEVTDQQLNKIQDLTFDGGNEIYQILVPNWDGEDGQFDVTDIIDILKLKNLHEIHAISMLNVQNYEPLLELNELKEIYYWHDLQKSNVAELLTSKGVMLK